MKRAEEGIKSNPSAPKKVVPKSIDAYNQELQKKTVTKKEEEPKEKKLFYTKNGKLRCIHKGCNKEFEEKDNVEGSCKYHTGQPVFHDLKKYWTCCKQETWDWDKFMKLPTCAVGKHVPKTI